ncbi:MAG: hypothetical protein ACLFTH_03550 [Candidatus Woesearchaeota archaeon]
MGFFDKLQFWKKSSDDFFTESANSGIDESFTGANEQSAYSHGNHDSGISGQQAGELPPLDMSGNDPQQQYAQNYNPNLTEQDSQGQFVDPGAHMNQQQGQEQMQSQPQFQQQMATDDQVTMTTENGERRIGKHLAQEYMKHQRQDQGSTSQETGGQQNTGVQGSASHSSLGHSLELINVKLDSLKNAMDAMSHRLLKIENDLEKERKRHW